MTFRDIKVTHSLSACEFDSDGFAQMVGEEILVAGRIDGRASITCYAHAAGEFCECASMFFACRHVNLHLTNITCSLGINEGHTDRP